MKDTYIGIQSSNHVAHLFRGFLSLIIVFCAFPFWHLILGKSYRLCGWYDLLHLCFLEVLNPSVVVVIGSLWICSRFSVLFWIFISGSRLWAPPHRGSRYKLRCMLLARKDGSVCGQAHGLSFVDVRNWLKGLREQNNYRRGYSLHLSRLIIFWECT